ncbi:TPA: TIGR01666 family membrane protein [Escherichia coli]|nr:TIGR01666 family membrane protein [Escherichia coli]
MAFMLSPLLKRYTWNSAWLYYARIFIALCGTTAFPWWLGDVKLTIPLTLGMVAAALTDLDDRLAGRLRNLIITLFCFFIASASVELLFPWPWLFAIGLTLSTSGFILLGGLGQRYATIAFGALLIAIYTMLGTSLYEHWYQQPMYLLAGAVWYNVLTLIGHLLFPVRPLQDNLARCYEQLARYLELKSRMFDPDIEDESQAPLYDLALANGQLMATLNQTKLSLLTRLRGDRGQRGTRRTLHYYFVAQDIHERASSSHIQYQTLREHFRHSDVLFRFQRLMSMQGQACQQLSRCILLRQYAHATMFITLLVLLCFNLLGEGFEVALPRVIDTLIGCAIAWAAVSYIWPDWKFRNLPRMLERATEANCRYLDAILEQYHQGRDNRLAYRIARRDAHNRDAELASVVSNMSSEPNVTPQIREAAFRLLCLNHTFTSYISALGAHREQLTNPEILAFLDDAVCYVDDALHHQPADEERVNQALAGLKQRMQQLEPRADSKEPLVVQQVGLLIALLPEIGRLQRQITQVPQETPVSA